VTTQPVRAPRELLADRAYVQLRDLIITLRIPPGAPIDEDRLGEALEMGRTPVREAVKRLALENLVTVFPRRGTFASEINITDLTHISDVRAVLEAHAAYLAAQRITDAQRAELAGLLDELSRSRGSDDGEALMALSTAFRTCSLACTSTTTCCTRSRMETPPAPARSSSSTSRRSSARSGRCSDRRGGRPGTDLSLSGVGRQHNGLQLGERMHDLRAAHSADPAV
jgi:hypothetical protein